MFGLDPTTTALIVAAILVVVFWPKIAEVFSVSNQSRAAPQRYNEPRTVVDVEIEPPLKDEVKALLHKRARLEDELTELRKLLQEEK